ncbi:MAG: hypothetical protein IKW80_00265 [Thermoguttaceae bacterium]|nr:hypothetical protein [Thermoguttaceae bacterium]
MKNKESIIRQITSSAYKICTIIVLALAVILVCGTTVNAQLPSSYGKAHVINGQLKFVSTATSTYRSTMTSGSTARILLFEPLGDKLVKVDYITKYPDIHLSLRVNGYDYAMCLVHPKPKEGGVQNNGPVRITSSGVVRLPAITPIQIKAAVEEAKKKAEAQKEEEKKAEQKEDEQKADEQKKEDEQKADEQKTEEAKKSDQIFPIIVLLQDKSGTIQFLAQTDENTLLEYQVKNLWELFIIVPDSCKKDLFELMKYFNPSVFTNEQNNIHRIYNAISKSVPINASIQNDYKQLIDDLSSDVYMKRVAAMNRIQKEGVNFQGFAQNLDMSQLEPEAQVRLARFLEQISFIADSDSIEDMSVLFANSLYAYIPLLESDNPPFFTIAQQRIREKLGDSFQFDKSAPDDVRAAQIQELKTKLNFPKPRTIQMDEHTQKRFKDLTEAIFDQSMSVFKF